MGMYNLFEEVSANVVNVTTGGIQKNYNKTDLKVSKTDQQVFVYYYTDGTNKTVASWNEFQAQEYGYTLSELKSRIDGILVSTTPTFSGLNISSVPEYVSQTDAIADGLKNGDVYRLPKASDNRLLAVVFALIESYTAGTPTIDFINNGGDDWTVGFKIAVNNLPSGYSVVNYDYYVTFYNAGNQTDIEDGNKTGDYNLNTSANGAGVYTLEVRYNITNGTINSFFILRHIIKVDNAGNILGAIKNNGIVVNSINGLSVDYTAYLTQIGVTETVNVDAVNATTYALTNLSHNLSDTVTLPLGSGGIIIYTNLDATFWADLGSLLGNYIATGNLFITTIT